MPTDASGMPDLSIPASSCRDMSEDENLRHPGGAVGLAERHRRHGSADYRDNYGVSYIIVQAPHAEPFSKVIAELK